MYKKKSFLVVIPARGESKRIPKKNQKVLMGTPLIGWTIRAAKKSKFIDKICVSTDDDTISKIVATFGKDLVTVKRPPALATDRSKIIDVIIHVMRWVKQNMKKRFDYVVLLQPTSPFRRASHINKAIKMLVNSRKADSIVSFRKAHFSADWFVSKNGNGLIEKVFNISKSSKDTTTLNELWIYNGAIYIGDWNNIERYRSFETSKTLLFEMNEYSSLDMDTQADWAYAEFIIKKGLLK